MGWMAHRKWEETKHQPGTAGPGNMLGCCLISFHFLWAIHPIRPVYTHSHIRTLFDSALGESCRDRDRAAVCQIFVTANGHALGASVELNFEMML